MIGFNITENTSQGIPTLSGTADLLLGLLGVFQRGPVNKPILVTGDAQFAKLFGTYQSSAFGAYAWDGYRKNGGRQAYVVRINGSGGTAASITLSDDAVSPLYTLKVQAGYKGSVDLGTWGNNLSITVADNAFDTDKFDLTVLLSSVEKEIWRGLTPATAVTAINDSEYNSEFIKVTNLASTSTAPDNNPTAVSAQSLSGGTNPAAPSVANLTGVAATHTGLYAFDGYEITHLICPESQDSTFQGSVEDYCANRGTIAAITSLAQATSVTTAITSGGNLQESVSYAACYLGWGTVIDPIGIGNSPVKVVPLDGHIAGMYASTWRRRGVHKAPAGVIDGNLKGVYGLDVDVLTDTDMTNLAVAGVNAIRKISGYGIYVATSRSLSKDTRWQYMNVRNLFNEIKRVLKSGLVWVQQEPNNESLWRKVSKDTVYPYMISLYNDGAFGPGDPEEVFTILCDSDNNPQSEVDLGNFNLDISLYPSKPAESIYVTISQQKSGASSVSER